MTTTANSILVASRLLARDKNSADLSGDMGLSIINNLLNLIHQTLINIQSELLRETAQITTVAGTAEYTLETGGVEIEAAGILSEGVWKDGYPGNPLTRKIKSDLTAAGYDLSDEAEPSFWYPTGLNSLGFCLTPDDAYIYNVYYWKALTELTAIGDNIPFNGIFDQTLKYWVASEYLTTIGEDVQYLAIQLKNAYNTAMQRVFWYGTTYWRTTSDMFGINGV